VVLPRRLIGDQFTNGETFLTNSMNGRSRDRPLTQSYPDQNSAFTEGSVSRMTGLCTPTTSQKRLEFRQRSRPFRSDTTNRLMNIERLKNIGPAPDSGPMRHSKLEGPPAPQRIMVHRHKKVTNLSRKQLKNSSACGLTSNFFLKMHSKPVI
jgi:hypothetical protein